MCADTLKRIQLLLRSPPSDFELLIIRRFFRNIRSGTASLFLTTSRPLISSICSRFSIRAGNSEVYKHHPFYTNVTTSIRSYEDFIRMCASCPPFMRPNRWALLAVWLRLCVINRRVQKQRWNRKVQLCKTPCNSKIWRIFEDTSDTGKNLFEKVTCANMDLLELRLSFNVARGFCFVIVVRFSSLVK